MTRRTESELVAMDAENIISRLELITEARESKNYEEFDKRSTELGGLLWDLWYRCGDYRCEAVLQFMIDYRYDEMAD